MSSLILHQHQQQYLDEGYFILESALSRETLDLLRDACDLLIDRMHIEMDRLKTDHIHISHRNQRYHIAKQYNAIDGLEKYVFGDVMAEICRATIGREAFLFYDQYVAKAAEIGRLYRVELMKKACTEERIFWCNSDTWHYTML